jgi:pimeloyl-ACP methyl ester carboxylesterase
MSTPTPVPVAHRTTDIDGIETFYREAGPADAPVVLLPHGYPCSSYEFRNLMPLLGDRWRLLAPDLPGFGLSATPAAFSYTFSGYGDFLGRFAEHLRLERYALYLHDYGSQFGLQLAMAAPERVTALIIQNGDIYEDTLGPKYEWLRSFWANPTDEGRERMAANVSEEGFRDEFAGDLPPHLAERIPPDLWKLHWALTTPERKANIVGLFEDQASTLARFPAQQAYLREHRPPTLIVWGPHDGYMPEESARAYLRDLPDAELHLLDAGHWALETSLAEIAGLMREFLSARA